LKTAALEKKRASLKNLMEKSGSAGDLIYLDARDRVVAAWQRGGEHVEIA
jgi:hypothetical protein